MESGYFFLKINGVIRKIELDKLVYVEVSDYLATFHMDDGTSWCCCRSLREIAQKLPQSFIIISRSCVVNLSKVKEIVINKRRVVTSDERVLRISSGRVKALSCLGF